MITMKKSLDQLQDNPTSPTEFHSTWTFDDTAQLSIPSELPEQDYLQSCSRDFPLLGILRSNISAAFVLSTGAEHLFRDLALWYLESSSYSSHSDCVDFRFCLEIVLSVCNSKKSTLCDGLWISCDLISASEFWLFGHNGSAVENIGITASFSFHIWSTANDCWDGVKHGTFFLILLDCAFEENTPKRLLHFACSSDQPIVNYIGKDKSLAYTILHGLPSAGNKRVIDKLSQEIEHLIMLIWCRDSMVCVSCIL